MKKRYYIVLLIVFVGAYVLIGCNQIENKDYLRIHIRAHSNCAVDQEIKYGVRDEVVRFLTPIICEAKGKGDALKKVSEAVRELNIFINDYLVKNNFTYTACVKINNEFFPTRVYDEVTLYANYYDAVIVELGEASGDNWWCVVYPPLCFKDGNFTSVVYKSKIEELINKYFKK